MYEFGVFQNADKYHKNVCRINKEHFLGCFRIFWFFVYCLLQCWHETHKTNNDKTLISYMLYLHTVHHVLTIIVLDKIIFSRLTVGLVLELLVLLSFLIRLKSEFSARMYIFYRHKKFVYLKEKKGFGQYGF